MKYFLPIILFFPFEFWTGCTNPGASGGAEVRDTTYVVQNELNGETTFRIADFNRDGAPDTLSHFDDSGSGFGGRYITLSDGQSGARFELNTFGCFCEIRREVGFPQGLDTAFRKAIETLFPPKKATPDGSLNWIIYGLDHRKEIENSTYFKEVIPFPNDWIAGPIELPSVYSLDLGADSLLIYYGHNHYDQNERGPGQDSLTKVSTSPDYEVWKTQHGLLAKKGQAYKWIFVTDAALTGAPEKLRRASIGDVVIDGPYVFLQQNQSLDDTGVLWVIDLEKAWPQKQPSC
ncbi:MAG: hypothetical protein IPL49_16320 [Saprospirales bacterium]|nr:hypothetical protein [Saprospirales bacterium]